MSKWLVILSFLCALLPTGYAHAAAPVRVRVLEKHHPVAIKIWTGAHAEVQYVNIDSKLPRTIDDGSDVYVDYGNESDIRRYPGSLIIHKGENELLLVNVAPVEDYVASVVLSELGWKHPEAMRAQAVLARTWLENHRQPLTATYDFGDLTNSQVYKGVYSLSAATKSHVAVPTRLILTFQEKPVDVLYYGACSSRTFSAFEIWGGEKAPYLTGRQLPPLLQTAVAENAWVRDLSKYELDKVFAEVTPSTKDPGYAVEHMRQQLGVSVYGRWVPVDEFRLRVNRLMGWNTLRSNDFSIEDTGNRLIIRGRGFGHLVGLCQKEADVLAQHGWNYKEILDFFYPGTKLDVYGGLLARLKVFFMDEY